MGFPQDERPELHERFGANLVGVNFAERGIVRMKIGISVALLCMGFASMAPRAQAQDLHPELQKKLDGLYTLTKVSADGNDVVKAGSILVLHKDGLHLASTQAKLPITNSYKDGRLSAGMGKWGLEEGIMQSELPTAQIPQKVFDSGEKIWVSAVSASKSGIVLKIYSDPYDDVRYYGQIEIPFDKKSPAPDDEMLKRLAEVVTVDAPTDTADVPAPGSAAAAAAEAALKDPKEMLKRKLAETFVLTTGNLSSGEIAKAGSIIELKKDGFVMYTTEYKTAPNYVYKDGKFSLPLAAWATAHSSLRAKDPEVNPENVPKRKFVAGEKFWIVQDAVRDNGIYLSFVSDEYSGVRYMGTMWFPVDKKTPMPTVDEFTRQMGELISVQPPPAQEQAATPAAPAAPATPAVQAPAPIAPPPAPPKTVTLGQSRDEVQAILGQPQKVVVLGSKEIEMYSDMRITLVGGKVTDIVVK
jgi:hypothetical protein